MIKLEYVGLTAAIVFILLLFVSGIYNCNDQINENKTRSVTCQQLCGNNSVFICKRQFDEISEKDLIVAVCREAEGYSVKTREIK